MSWERPTDLELIKAMLEESDIDFDEADKEGQVVIETHSNVLFTFDEDGKLLEVDR